MTAAAKIGLFMLIALIILGVFIIRIEDIPVGERGERLLLSARVPSAAGLDKKAAVRIAGVRVGKVEEVGLDGSEAMLTLSLDPGVELHVGAAVQISSMGMLGDRYVEIYPGDPSAPALPAGSVLSGTTPPSFDDVMQVATDIGADVKQVTAALRDSIGGPGGSDKLAEIIDNIRELTESLKVLIAENQSNVNRTTDNFRMVSATLRDELPAIVDKINRLADQLNGVVGDNRDNMQASLANIRDLSDRLRTSADNLNTITGKIASGEGSIGKLVNDDETVDNLNETLDSISDGVETLNDSIGRFRRYELDMTIRGEALTEIEESRTAFGFDLWTTDRRFFRVEGVDTPLGRTRTRTETVTTVDPLGNAQSYTETTVTTEDSLAFNAQIGYRVAPNTVLRAGLFESSGGFGVDYDFKLRSQPLRVTLEMYDFSRANDQDPHLRLESRYYFTKHLFVMAGWDDAMVSTNSSVLFGGGVTWLDEDIKYSLGLAAGAVGN